MAFSPPSGVATWVSGENEDCCYIISQSALRASIPRHVRIKTPCEHPASVHAPVYGRAAKPVGNASTSPRARYRRGTVDSGTSCSMSEPHHRWGVQQARRASSGCAMPPHDSRKPTRGSHSPAPTARQRGPPLPSEGRADGEGARTEHIHHGGSRRDVQRCRSDVLTSRVVRRGGAPV